LRKLKSERSAALSTGCARMVYSILAHPVVSVFYQPSPKQQKYQNFLYKKAVREWLR
jgi:hypothetical protein